MKLCAIWGDLSADRQSDINPHVNICEDCIESNTQDENSIIAFVAGDYDPKHGDECYICQRLASDII